MSNSLVNAYIYENLKEIYAFCKTTRLCVYEPTGKLFVLKSVGLAQKASYEALLALNNPHLAKILYVAETADRAEVVCEYISGDTLADLIRGGRCLPPDTAIRIAADICDGLSDMHRLGYVHRDINPNNIIVSSDGHAVIIDYGIARCFSQGKNTDTVILGTPGYAAPEQFGSYGDLMIWSVLCFIFAVVFIAGSIMTKGHGNQPKDDPDDASGR